jgi:cytochrome c553
MRKSIFFITVLAVIISITTYSCNSNNEKATAGKEPTDSASLVKRGDYLVTSIGCGDCHSPKRMGPQGPEIIPELKLSGSPHDLQLPPLDTASVKKGWILFTPDLTVSIGPWGASYSANLTGDATGVRDWTEENFIRCIREGKYKGLPNGRPLLPPMPWGNFKNLTDDDLKAILAYLKSVNPVKNVVQAPKSLAELK